MRYISLLQSVTGVNKCTPKPIAHPRDEVYYPYSVSKGCQRINGLRHIVLTQSVRGFIKDLCIYLRFV